MTSDWIEDGSLQLRLALLWERHALAMVSRPRTSGPDARPPRETPGDGSRELADSMFEQAFRQALQTDWFPGARLLAEQFVKKWEKSELPSAATVGAQIDRFTEALRTAFAKNPGAAAQAEPQPTDRHEAALLELIRWAANTALRTREATADPPAATAGLPPASALRPPARTAAACWLAQGAAVAAWGRLSHEARRQDDAETHLARIPRLAQECGELRAWAYDWRQGSLAFGPFLGSSPGFSNLLQNVEQCLGRCADALTKLQSSRTAAVNEAALRERRDSIRLVDAALARAPEGWPPLILAELQEEFYRRGPASLATAVADAATQLPSDDLADPRTLAVLAVADRLAAANLPSDHAAWDALERAATRLMAAPDGVEGVAVVRGAEGEPAAVRREENDRLPANQPPLLRRPGLVTRRAGRAEVIRPAVVEVGRGRPPAVALFRKVGKGLSRQSDDADSLELAGLFYLVAHDLAGFRDLPSWWAAATATATADPERLGRFWQAVQRAAALAAEGGPLGAAAGDLLTDLSGTFQFVPPGDDGPAVGHWLLMPSTQSREAAPLYGTPSPALRGPDGRVLQPAGWLRVPRRWDGESTAVRRLAEAQPLLTGLRGLDPEWPGWSAAGGLAWDLAFRGTGGAGPFEPTRAREAFEAAYHRAQKADDPLAPAFAELARRLLGALQAAGTPVVPALDPTTLRPLVAASALPAGTDVRYVASDQPAGAVVEVTRFGVGNVPAAVAVSLGKNPPAEAAAWLNWAQSAAPAEADVPPAVRAWRAELPGLLSRPEALSARSKVRQAEFLDWAATEPGRDAFDRLVRSAADPDGGDESAAARGLVEALTRSKWCQIAPAVDPATGHGLWPRGRRADSAPRVEWAERPGVPFGEASPSKFRFAPVHELVEGAFSLGTPAPGSPLAAALAIDRAARSEPRAGSGLRAAARALLAAQTDEDLGATPAPAHELLGPLLDALVSAAGSYPEAAPALDAALDAARDWANAHGLSLRPAAWSFARPPAVDQFAREGFAAPRPAFGDAPAKSLTLLRLGWFGGPSGTDREPALALSAGPISEHYEALRERLAAASNWPHAKALLEELGEWPVKRVEGADVLRFEAEHLFSAFWDAAGPPPRPAEVEQAAVALERLLRDEFQLETFVPATLNDFGNEWTRVFGRGGAKNGRVARVIRPGLRSPVDGLSFAAWVDVE